MIIILHIMIEKIIIIIVHIMIEIIKMIATELLSIELPTRQLGTAARNH